MQGTANVSMNVYSSTGNKTNSTRNVLLLVCFCKTLHLKSWSHWNQWEFLLLLRSRISAAGSAFSPAYFSPLSCPRLQGPLALHPPHLFLPSRSRGFSPTQMHKQILKSLPLNLPMQTRASAPKMPPWAEKRRASCQSRAPGWQAGCPLLSSYSFGMERSTGAHSLPSVNVWIAQPRGCRSHVPRQTSAGHSPKQAPRKEEEILAKWLLPKRTRKTHRRQGIPKSQSGSSMSRIAYLTLAVWIKKKKRTGIKYRVYLIVYAKFLTAFTLKCWNSPNSYLSAYVHQGKYFQYLQAGTMSRGKQWVPNCNWHF